MLALSVLLSCNSSGVKPASEIKTKSQPPQCIYEKPQIHLQEAFPFSEANRVEVISYDACDIIGLDSCPTGKTDSLRLSGKLIYRHIQERIILDSLQIFALFELVNGYRFETEPKEFAAKACYVPHHTIVFFRNDEFLAHLEVCLTCNNYASSGGEYLLLRCDKVYPALNAFFKQAGIRFEVH